MGCVHIYCGDGKGKTTAAVGLAVRMQGCGGYVIAARFLKTDESGEVGALKSLPGIELLPCDRSFGFTWQMTDAQREEASGYYGAMFERARERALELCDRLEEKEREEKKNAVDFLRKRPHNLEVVMTGRNPSEELLGEADYISEIVCRRHPFEKGMTARRGIEY